jgi:hypothetical protein
LREVEVFLISALVCFLFVGFFCQPIVNFQIPEALNTVENKFGFCEFSLKAV